MAPALNWIPLESNPKVFNGWASKAGLDITKDSFNDLYSFDPEMLSMIPRPVKAVIFVFPFSEAQGRRIAEDEKIAREGGNQVDKSVFWMKQTIRNACGAMAIIHSLANVPVTLAPSSPLSTFYDSARPKAPLERSELFANTPEFEVIHSSMISAGQCILPHIDDVCDQAYTAFVLAPGKRVVELDGGRTGPVDCGSCEGEEDLLDAVVRIAKDNFIGKSGSIKFNMMYLGQPVLEA
ncbi:cysteine proteinase [Marasmius fiardii PR-910]|nr:cysteine proteinase [Marasmius fiardii PR-910]